LLFADVLRLGSGADDDPKSPGLLGNYDVLAGLYVVSGQAEPAAVVSRLRSALASSGDARVGVSELPNGCGCAVRLLGPSSRAVRAALRVAWDTARRAVLGAPAPNLRKG
jgi:urease accessory protein